VAPLTKFLKSLDKAWFVWQVIIPLLGPVIISLVVVGAWATGNPRFTPRLEIAVDVTPWALTFYSLTLIGSTFNEFWAKLGEHPALGVGLILNAMAVTLYASFMVIWRHDPTFTPGAPVYIVTLALLLISIWLCYTGYRKGKHR
jgi:hypothetical protein